MFHVINAVNNSSIAESGPVWVWPNGTSLAAQKSHYNFTAPPRPLSWIQGVLLLREWWGKRKTGKNEEKV